MPDRIDELMAKHWPRMQKHITKGLALEPRIEKFVPLNTADTFGPYRVGNPMEPAPVRPAPRQPIDRKVGVELRKFDLAAIEGAFELTVDRELDVLALEGNIDSQMESFGKEARLAERRALLEWLGRGGRPRLTETTLRSNVAALGRPCTLIWDGCGNEPRSNFEDLVDDCVDPGGCLPVGIVALLVPQVSGPAFVRVVDDLTASWERTSEGSLRLTVFERFFLDHEERAIVFRDS